MSGNPAEARTPLPQETQMEGEGEVSANRSDTDARIDAIECEIGALQTELAGLRAARQREQVEDYEFKTVDGGTVWLSALFDGRPDLVLIHNMGKGCNYCTLWLDGFIGLLPHLENRAAFVVVSPDPPDVQQEFAASRSWPFRIVSAHGSPFTNDMGFLDRDGDPMPGVSTFKLDEGGRILRIQRAEFGPGDLFSPVWHFFDLLDGGVAGWEPKRSY